MSLIDMPSIRSRSRMNDLLRRARPDADLLALEVLDRLDVGAGLGDHAPCPCWTGADDHDRLAGRAAQDGGGDAEGAEVDRPGDHRVLAVGRAVERQ